MDPKEILKTIGENLKTIREKKHITQDKLGSAMEVTGQSVSLYEKGENLFPIYKLPSLLKSLKCTAEELFSPYLGKHESDSKLEGIIVMVKRIYRFSRGPDELEKFLEWIDHDLSKEEREKDKTRKEQGEGGGENVG